MPDASAAVSDPGGWRDRVEIQGQQVLLRDMAALLALPELWSVAEPSRIIQRLADVLLSLLRLQLAYVHLPESSVGPAVDAAAVDGQPALSRAPEKVSDAIAKSLRTGGQTFLIDPTAGIASSPLRATRLSLGREDEAGFVVAGSARGDFPTEVETFLLALAVNQGAVTLENARLYLDAQRSLALLRTVIEQMPAGVIIAEAPSGRIILSNDQMSKILAMPPASAETLLDDQRFRHLFPDDSVPHEWPWCRALLKGETVQHEELRFVRPDGVLATMHASAAPVRGPEGNIIAAVAALSDITELKRTQEHLIELERRSAEEERRRAEALAEVNRANEQALEDVAGRLITAQEEERGRIGRELHDDIVQQVALLTINLDQLRTDRSAVQRDKRLDELRCQAEAIAEDIHHLSHRLHSSMLDQLGLEPAVRQLVREFSECHPIRLEFVATALPVEMTAELRLCLFRVVQESLGNIAKHSGARSARIALAGRTDGIELIVEDDGVGFDLRAVEGKAGLGFISMRERVRLVQGTIRVHSVPSRGTRMEVRVPRRA